MFISEFIEYLKKIRRCSNRTYESYQYNLTRLNDWASNRSQSLDTLTARDIKDYMCQLMDEGVQPKSINQFLSSFRSYYDYTCRFCGADNNPAVGIRDVRTPKTLPKFIREEKMNLLIDKLLPATDFKRMRTRIIVLVFYHTGIRCSELAQLTDDDICLSTNCMKIRGKGNKERFVPFGDDLHDELLRYMQMRPAGSSSFLRSISGQPLTQWQIRIVTKMALLRIVPADYAHPHVLRHTFATVLMNHGAKIERVKLLLGHASVNTTCIYEHVSISSLKQIYNTAFQRI